MDSLLQLSINQVSWNNFVRCLWFSKNFYFSFLLSYFHERSVNSHWRRLFHYLRYRDRVPYLSMLHRVTMSIMLQMWQLLSYLDTLSPLFKWNHYTIIFSIYSNLAAQVPSTTQVVTKPFLFAFAEELFWIDPNPILKHNDLLYCPLAVNKTDPNSYHKSSFRGVWSVGSKPVGRKCKNNKAEKFHRRA